MSARDEMQELLDMQLDDMDCLMRTQASIYRDLAVTSEETWREQRKVLVAGGGPLAPLLAAEHRFKQAARDLEGVQAEIPSLHGEIVRSILWLDDDAKRGGA
jgi:hypothetical protein